MKLPRNFDLADLEANANTLSGRGPAELATRRTALASHCSWTSRLRTSWSRRSFARLVGTAKDANRVEVPFRLGRPPRIDGGRMTAERKSKCRWVGPGRPAAALQLGQGTSQHVLIAGKTGSGKSTFMHALITNLAIHYSPSELQFYLVDFKKGVEFKTYAQVALAARQGGGHRERAGVWAERVAAVGRRTAQRGDQFRVGGVQSLAGFRDAIPDVGCRG